MIPRQLAPVLKKRFLAARSVYIFGPRQSGKTTLARETFPELPYRNLEDPDTLEYITDDPRGFLGQFSNGVIIDEPQRFPDIFSYLQSQIDIENKRFILTSSQNFLSMESITQSLAGRITFLNLFPLSKAEIENRSVEDFIFTSETKSYQTVAELSPLILTGGYPELQNSLDVQDFWFADYVRTYLERDIRDVIKIHDIVLFQRFIKLCAGRTGNILNKSSLASDCGVSESTCMRWLGLLEQSGIITLVKPYHTNFNKRLIKSPTLYFMDTGLLCHLLGIKNIGHLDIHPLYGAIVETFAFCEIYKHFANQGILPEIYFWRDNKGMEIDLIIDMPDGTLLPIEVKAGQTVQANMFDSLKKWQELTGTTQGILLYGGSEPQTRHNVKVIPLDGL